MNSETNYISLKLDKSLYSSLAVNAALYKFEDKCFIKMNLLDEKSIEIVFKYKNSSNVDKDIQEIADEFCNELIDQELRVELEKRFFKIRELIVEHAFSPINNLETQIKDHV